MLLDNLIFWHINHRERPSKRVSMEEGKDFLHGTSMEEGNDNRPLQAIRQLTAPGGPMTNARGGFGRNGVNWSYTDMETPYSLLLFSFLHGVSV